MCCGLEILAYRPCEYDCGTSSVVKDDCNFVRIDKHRSAVPIFGLVTVIFYEVVSCFWFSFLIMNCLIFTHKKKNQKLKCNMLAILFFLN